MQYKKLMRKVLELKRVSIVHTLFTHPNPKSGNCKNKQNNNFRIFQ